MEKLNLKEFSEHKVNNPTEVRGGHRGDTAGGDYFFGKGNSTCDYEQPDGSGCIYYFEDASDVEGDC